MKLWKKSAVVLAAASMTLSSAEALAAPAVSGARAVTAADGPNKLEGASWIPMVLALAIIAGGVWLAVDGDNDDEPVSP